MPLSSLLYANLGVDCDVYIMVMSMTMIKNEDDDVNKI